MRILFVTTNKHLPELRGGMEVNTHGLTTVLLKRGASVGVLCGLAGVGLTGINARFRRKLLGDPYPKDMKLGYPTWRSYDAISSVAPLSASFKPDVLVVQGGADFIPLVTTCLGSGLPVVCYLHSQDRLILPSEILQSPRISFIANSSFTKSMHAEKEFLGVVPPIVPSDNYFTNTSRSHAVFVNPVRYKGLDIVLYLAENRPDVRFMFVVNRRDFKFYGTGVQAWTGLPNVKLIGPVMDMRRVYRCAKLILAPSQWLETWGRVATEAHCSGIPVLASDRGGLPEAVGPGGICLPADAPFTLWRAAFSAIWDNPIRYEQLCEAATLYSQRPDIDVALIAESFLSLLARAVRRASQSSAGG